MSDTKKKISSLFSFRCSVLIVIVAVGVTVSLGLFGLLYRWETRGIVEMFHKASRDHHALLSQQIEGMLQGVEATANFFETSEEVTPEEFQHFAGYYTTANDDLLTIGWAPSTEQRPGGENPDIRPTQVPIITERPLDGRGTSPSGQFCSYPIWYITSPALLDRYRGFNLGSVPALRERIAEARDKGSAIAAIPHTTGISKGHGYIAFISVYRGGKVPRNETQRRLRFQGVVFGLFSPENVIENNKKRLTPSGLDIAIYEKSSSGRATKRICFIPSRTRSDEKGDSPDRQRLLSSDRVLAGRAWIFAGPIHWLVDYMPVETAVIAHRTLLPWLYCGVGLLLTLAAWIYVRSILREAGRVQTLVDQRTSALRESRQELLLFRDTLEHAPDAVIIIDADMRLIYQNPKSRRMFGYRDERFVESGGPQVLFTTKAASRILRATVRKGKKWFGETQMQNCRGETFPALVRGAPVRNEEGENIGYLGIITDITLQKEREKILQEREAILKSIMEAGNDALLVINSASKQFTYYNRRALEIFDLRKDDLRKNDFEVIRRHLISQLENGQTIVAKLDQAYQQLKSTTIELVFRDGRFVELNFSPLIRAGTVFGYVWKAYDITDRIEAERELRRREQEARHVQKLEAVGTLANGIAHEFNNLLQVITGYTSCVLDELPPDDPRHLDLAKAMKASKRAAELTHQLLSFGGRQVMNVKKIGADQVIDEFSKMIRPLLGENIEIAVRQDAGSAVIEADSSELQHLLLNLCINAREAMPQGGELTITTSRVELPTGDSRLPAGGAPGNYVVLSVADTGIGMTEEIQERIFEPFFTTKKEVTGTGMGLAIAFGIVEQHHGTIQVESAPGKGTTFRIFLPACPGGEDETPREPAALTVPGRGETILVADDEPMVLELSVRLLEKHGFHVLAASDGTEAVELFRRHAEQISLVVLDMIMPSMNGDDTYREICGIRPDTKVIFCTGYDPASMAADYGVLDHPTIIKPIAPQELYNKIHEILEIESKEIGAC